MSNVRRILRTALVSAMTSAALVPALTTGADALTPAPDGIVFGVVGDLGGLQTKTGQHFALHAYSRFETLKVPQAAMLTVRAQNNWRTTAAAAPGTALYSNIVRWADTLKARKTPIYLAFHHEPNNSTNLTTGTPAEYIAAYRRVVDIFRQRGATNVVWTWQMTGWAFRAKPTDRDYAAKWYPGDNYVDVVGGDVYNWYRCGSGNGRWASLRELTEPIVAFAVARGKQVALPEFASVANPQRAAWLRDARAYLASKDSVIAAAFYFQQIPMNSANADCVWSLTAADEFSAFGAFTGSTPFVTATS